MRIISIIAAVVLTANSFAQNINVIDINVIPSAPTPTDVIKIATRTSTPYLGESYGLSFLSLSQDTIYITGCFLDGAAAQPKTYYDTISIGTLPTGNYHIAYEARVSPTGICDTLYGNDWGQVNFLVGALSIDEQAKDKNIVLYPNPSTGFQSITIDGSGNEKLQIDLYDTQGRLIRNIYTGFISSGQNSINTDVSDLSPSLYFYRVRHGSDISTLRFLKL